MGVFLSLLLCPLSFSLSLRQVHGGSSRNSDSGSHTYIYRYVAASCAPSSRCASCLAFSCRGKTSAPPFFPRRLASKCAYTHRQIDTVHNKQTLHQPLVYLVRYTAPGEKMRTVWSSLLDNFTPTVLTFYLRRANIGLL